MVQPKMMLSKLGQSLEKRNQKLREIVGQQKPRTESEAKLFERIKNRKNRLRVAARQFEQRLTWTAVAMWVGKSLIKKWTHSKVRSKKLF